MGAGDGVAANVGAGSVTPGNVYCCIGTSAWLAATTEQPLFDPESGELLLGDIVISTDHCRAQAVSYGHSVEREYAFLIAHSMLHLCGYDHESVQEEKEMFSLQEEILERLGILR